MKQLLITTLIATSLSGLSMAEEFVTPVNLDNYNEAAFAEFANNWVAKGADKNIVNLPILVPAGNKAPVVRMNQDSLYSSAVVHADKDGYVTVTIDKFENEAGTQDVYTSVHVLDEFSASPAYKVGTGTYRVKIDTDWAFVIFRAGVEDKSDLSNALAAQSRFHVDFSDSSGGYKSKNYNVDEREVLTTKLKAEFLRTEGDMLYVGSVDSKEADNYVQAMTNATGWGGMPLELGVSNIYRTSTQFDGSICQQITTEVPNNKYFTSITLYDAAGYMLDTGRFSINSYEWDLNKNGTITISFGCDKKAPNNLETNGQNFNYSIRNYGASGLVAADHFGGLELKILADGSVNPKFKK